MSSSIAVSKVVKTTTNDKDSYEVTLKGEMRFDAKDAEDPKDTYSEMAEIELKIKGINQKELLIENGVFWIGAVKVLDLKDVQTTLDSFIAHDPYRISDHIIDQELWISPLNGDIRTRNEVRATYLDLEEQGGMEDMTFLQFLEGQTSVDELYEETPEVITAIRLYKHGYNFWGPRMQVYAGDSDNAGLWR
jgi:hypothetical protein